MSLPIIAGIVLIVINVIAYLAIAYLAQARDNVLYMTIGRAHETGLDGCERIDEDLTKSRCIEEVNRVYNMGVFTLSLVIGIPVSVLIIVLVAKLLDE